MGIGHQVQDLGAERVAGERIFAHVEHRVERFGQRVVGIEPRCQHQQLVQVGVRLHRFVAPLVGVAVVEVVVILVGERLVARVVAHHQRCVVERRIGVGRLGDDVLLDGDFRRGQRREQEQCQQ